MPLAKNHFIDGEQVFGKLKKKIGILEDYYSCCKLVNFYFYNYSAKTDTYLPSYFQVFSFCHVLIIF